MGDFILSIQLHDSFVGYLPDYSVDLNLNSNMIFLDFTYPMNFILSVNSLNSFGFEGVMKSTSNRKRGELLH